MMTVYKAFEKDLTCRGYQFSTDKVNITEEANCVQNGFHAAENPLDCLSYYSDMDNAVYWKCSASGDIDEDGNDSKISCTELTLIKELTVREFVIESIKYMQAHPFREWSNKVSEERAEADSHFAIARGKNPVAKGKVGTILGFVKECENSSNILAAALLEIDGFQFKADTWYDIYGNIVESEETK